MTLARLRAAIAVGLLLIGVVNVEGSRADTSGPRSPSARSPISIKVLGNRADLVAGGDVLIEVVVASGSSRGLTVRSGARDVSRAFTRPATGPMRGRFVGLLTGLPNGPSVISAHLADGRATTLSVINHASGGPIFSGAQVQPWTCTTGANALGPPRDAQCNAPAMYHYRYKSAATGLFRPYSLTSPPADLLIARTTTDEGKTVPYIVRIEQGTLNRGIYDIAVLYSPGKPYAAGKLYAPWSPPTGWNRKLVYTFGGGCAPGHTQGTPLNVLLDIALKRGFMVAESTLDANGNACNMNVDAETLMMVKEHITERYGEIRYTIGDGCSGGAEAQNSIADNYPGLLDGIRPTCTFADAFAPAILVKSDCALLEHYFESVSPALWAIPAQRTAVMGTPTETPCLTNQVGKSAEEDWDPTTGCKVTGPWIYSASTNPRGVRCTLQDYNVAAIGFGAHGYASGVLDDVGVMWGLGALKAGLITADQFVDLNAKIGGWSIDYQPVAARTAAPAVGLARMYVTGQISDGHNLAHTPSIDARTDWTEDLHANVQREILQARVAAFPGGTTAHVEWLEVGSLPSGAPTPVTAERTLVVMDQWLHAIEMDHSGDPWAAKVLRARPPAAHNACYSAGAEVSASLCSYTHGSLPRLVAGMGIKADALACQRTRLVRTLPALRGLTFTPGQWAQLTATFATGVCDYSKPGIGQRAPLGDWLSLMDPAGPRRLGTPPVSIAS